MNKYKHVIWDWNGTILDDAWLCVEVMNEVLKVRELPLISLSSYRKHFCFPVKQYYKQLGFDFKKEKFETSGLEFINKYLIRKYEPKIYSNFKYVIETLIENGISHSILSAQDETTLKEVTKYYKVDKYFKNIVGLKNQYAHGKIEVGKDLFKKLEYENNQILIIGDTKHDGEVASEIGIKGLLLSCGHNDNSQLKQTPHKIIHSHLEIINQIIY